MSSKKIQLTTAAAEITGEPKPKRTRKSAPEVVVETVEPVSFTQSASVQQIPVNRVRAGNNDRKHFDENALRELADSIQAHGLAQPITVRPVGDGFEIVAGERRFRAMSTVLNWEFVPAIVRVLSDEEASAIMLVENTSRVDLDPIAEAKAFQVRVEKFNWSDAEIAKAAGLSVERVRSRLKLLALPDDIQHFVKIGQFPLGHAACIVDLDKDRQRIALRAFNSAKSMPLGRFQEIVTGLRNAMLEESQMTMFDLELQVMAAVADEQQYALRGKKARTGAPVRRDLPKVKVSVTDGVGDICDRYIRELLAAGRDEEAGAIGTLYNALVATNYVSVPAGSVLAKTGEQAAGDMGVTEAL